MLEIKVQCDCGQRYKFDVEPVNGRMPITVNCPTCGADGTGKANLILSQSQPSPTGEADRLPPAAHPVTPRLRLSIAGRDAPPTPESPPPPPPPRQMPVAPASTAAARSGLLPAARPTGASSTSTLGLGIVGALLGAAVSAGLMYGFFVLLEFRFPLLGVGIGALTGLGARLLSRGTASSLGGAAAVIALVAVVMTLYLMYGSFPMLNIISVVVSVSVAYRIASR
jgi:hypothetical protein